MQTALGIFTDHPLQLSNLNHLHRNYFFLFALFSFPSSSLNSTQPSCTFTLTSSSLLWLFRIQKPAIIPSRSFCKFCTCKTRLFSLSRLFSNVSFSSLLKNSFDIPSLL